MPDITAANTVFIISAPLLLPVPQQLQGFAADDIFDTDEVASAETLMGVDGILSGGMVFAPTPMNIALQADSVSVTFFEAVDAAQQGNTQTYALQANVTFPALGKSYTLISGYLTRLKRIADTKRLVQPRRFRIEWQSVTVLPVSAAG
jgi:hypothetical protein